MQIVIDITEEAYNLLQNEGVDWLGAEHILDGVANGTPLPENPTNGDMVQAIFDDRGYKAIKERMEYTMWWNTPYERREDADSD